MNSAYAIALLRACVVRFDHLAKLDASGFFVAPGTVVTCAHVVPGGVGTRVVVRYGNAVYKAKVVASSPAQEPTGGNLVEFPDLAVLRLADPPPGHPCARLDARLPQWGSDLAVLGHSAAFGGSNLGATPATFGEHGPFLRLLGLEVAAGMSGGPVLSVASGGVCAVTKAQRQAGTEMGGLAVPLRGLRRLDPTVYRELRRSHDRFHRDDPRWSEVLGALPPWAARDITHEQATRLHALLAELPAVDGHAGRYLRAHPFAAPPDLPQLDFVDTATDLRECIPAAADGPPHVVVYAADLVREFAGTPVSAALRDWVHVAAGRFGVERAVRERLDPPSRSLVRVDPADPRVKVERFRAVASPSAYELAAHLAAAPLTRPVIDRVCSLVGARREHVFEVLNSGLVVEDPQATTYEFADGVRAVLLGALTPYQTRAVSEVAGQYAAEYLARDEAPSPRLAGLFAKVRSETAHRTQGTAVPADVSSTFGRLCPICQAGLGPPFTDARTGRFVSVPSFRLELNAPSLEPDPGWRVTAPGVNFAPVSSVQPPFDAAEVEEVYLYCGKGHAFAQSLVVDDWKTVTVVGGLAAGKTYLLTRLLHQPLVDSGRWERTAEDANRFRRNRLSRLDAKAHADYRHEYRRTIAELRPAQPTSVDPGPTLKSWIPDAADAVRENIRRTVVDGDRRADLWGQGTRHPLVVHAGTPRWQTWTGFIDLPGETFAEDHHGRWETHDAVLWVLDPAIDRRLGELLEDAGAVPASLRPGTAEHGDVDVVRRGRRGIQADIGQRLVESACAELYVAVSKCDLIHAVLRQHSDLTVLGPPGAVLRGTLSYLSYAAGRPGAATSFLGRLRTPQDYTALAEALLGHFSEPTAFWSLVHGGDADTVDIPALGMSIQLPDVGEHLDQFTRTGSARRPLVRDLVMSAVACGIACGIGQRDAVHQLLDRSWRRLEFVLCSPLTAVPHSEAAGEPGYAQVYRLRPADPAEVFPAEDERSAGLVQLLVLLLGGSGPRERTAI